MAARSGEGSVLVIAPSWLGDCVMCLPGLELLARERPSVRAGVAAKRSVLGFWRLARPDLDLRDLPPLTPAGLVRFRRDVSSPPYDAVVALPRSPRATILALASGAPARRGASGAGRTLLFGPPVGSGPVLGDPVHRSATYASHVLGRRVSEGELPPPTLRGLGAPERPGSGPAVLLPGAARGPSKRWPAERFAAVGRALAAEGFRVAVCGSAAEVDLCGAVASGVGGSTENLAGRTDIASLAGLLASAPVTVANDSGGAHLAAAAGSPTVVIFGVTDPVRTAPRGPRVTVIKAAAAADERVGRGEDSGAARAFDAVTVGEVTAAARAAAEKAPDGAP